MIVEQDRAQVLRDAVAFATAGGSRPRAVVIRGERGIGKTTMLEQLQVELLARGRVSIVVVDDAQDADVPGVERVRAAIDSDARTLVLVAGREIPEPLRDLVDRRCERRVFDVPPLRDEDVRSLVEQLGIQPWTLRARQVRAAGGGNPRRIIDRACEDLKLDELTELDTSFEGAYSSDGMAERLRVAYAAFDSEALGQLRATALARADDDDFDPAQRAEAELMIAEFERGSSNLERSIQYGERASSRNEAKPGTRLLGAANAAAARALRGEPTAMLSLHALAGRAARSDMPVVEAMLWYLIGWCSGVLGDVSTARRAGARAVLVADASHALLVALRARMMLAELHLAAGEPGAATSYLEEIAAVARARGYERVVIDAVLTQSRASLALGVVDAACRQADEALELVIHAGAHRNDVVDCAVVAARAYAAAGSTDLALAPLDALASELGGSHSPDFWLVLEAVRVLGRAASDPAAFKRWVALMATFGVDGHGGALRAAHAEVEAWTAAADGRRAEAARLAERARQLWIMAECHDELPLTEPLVHRAPLEHGPRIQLVGSTSGGVAAPAEDPEAFAVLTRREREIARYVSGGLTNPEIAAELHLSPRTVEHHVASILRKLELPNRRELVRGRV